VSAAENFVRGLLRKGVLVWCEDELVRFRTPNGSLAPQDREKMRAHKGEILSFLRNNGLTSGSLSEIEALRRGAAVPLSYAQEGLWVLEQMGGLGPAYTIRAAVQLEGNLDTTALQWALSEIVRRHETLRTRFVQLEGEAVQWIDPPERFVLERLDVSLLPAAEQSAQVRRLIEQEQQCGFDLSSGPLFRVRLCCLSADRHVLLLSMHHSISDGWSLGVLTRELSVLYTSAGQSVLPELQVQYADYALLQRKRLQGELLERHMRYWSEQLSGAPALLELPGDRARPSRMTHRGSIERFALSGALSSALKSLAREEGATLFMVLLGGFGVLLSKLSGQSDVVVGTPVAGRLERRTEELIGYFVNTLALRLKLTGGQSFREYLREVKQVALGAYAHQELPFEHLVQRLCPERSLARTPVFQVMFVLESFSGSVQLELSGLKLKLLSGEHTSSKFDLTLSVRETASELQCAFEYSTDLFDQSTIQRFTEHFRTLLGAVVTEPQRRISELSLLTAAKQRQMLALGNQSRAEYTQTACVHELIANWARKTPDAIAVTCGDTRLTYAELNGKANRLARHLQSLGVGPDHLVALCLPRSPDMIIAMLAVMKAGGAYVPMDPTYPKERLSFILKDTAAQVLVTQRALADSIPPTPHLMFVDVALSEGQETGTTDVLTPVVPQNLLYCIYTSGSTGNPKGTLITHAHVLRLFDASRQWLAFSSKDVWTLFHSYAFDFSVWEVFGALIHGGRLVIVPFVVSRSPDAFMQLLFDEHVTVLNQTPSAFRQLLPLATATHAPHLMKLRYVIFGGEALDPAILQPWFAKYGSREPLLINMYGITETTVHVTIKPITHENAAAPATSPVGVPLSDLQVYILNEHLSPVPIGVKGEIYVGGAGLARGYLNRPALTAQRFIPNPFSSTAGGRLYASGDLARRCANGEIEFIGRADHQVKLRGHRIELGEIEACLRDCAGVADAVVRRIGVDDDSARLIAWLVPANTSSPPDRGELRQKISARLPAFMVPAELLVIDALPLTINGKLDTARLPIPAVGKRDLQLEAVAPRNSREQLLAEIWREALQLDTVGVHDNFFSLGGDSIRALQLVRLAQGRGLALTVQRVFECQTLSELAESIDPPPQSANLPLDMAHLPREEVGELPEELEELYPVTTMQQIMLTQYAQDVRREGVYHPQQSLRLHDPSPSEKAMRQALEAVAAAHPVLRTVFVRTRSGALAQGIRKTVPLAFTSHDVSALSPSEQQAYIAAAAQRDLMKPFAVDGFDEPLFRVQWFLTKADEFELYISIHHAIDDGWGNQHFLSQLFELYEQSKRGAPPQLAPRKNVFREFVALELAMRQSKEAAEFWKARRLFTTDTACLRRSPSWRNTVYRESFQIEAHTARRLDSLGRSLGVSMKALLLCAYLELIESEVNYSLPTVGVVANGRTAELSDPLNALGLFWNLVPFALPRLVRERSAKIQLVQRVLVEMEPYAIYPLSQIAAQRGATDLFFATFNFVNFHNAARLDDASGLRFLRGFATDRFHYPLNHRFAMLRRTGEISVVAEYDGGWYSDFHIRTMNRALADLLCQYAADGEAPSAQLAACKYASHCQAGK
jgi:amino acid adenylation domain-containing protein